MVLDAKKFKNMVPTYDQLLMKAASMHGRKQKGRWAQGEERQPCFITTHL
jgi:hypothetical protein